MLSSFIFPDRNAVSLTVTGEALPITRHRRVEGGGGRRSRTARERRQQGRRRRQRPAHQRRRRRVAAGHGAITVRGGGRQDGPRPRPHPWRPRRPARQPAGPDLRRLGGERPFRRRRRPLLLSAAAVAMRLVQPEDAGVEGQQRSVVPRLWAVGGKG